MPREGRKPISVDEVTWKATKEIINSEETDYETYDDFIRASVESADGHYGILEEDLSEAVSDGRRVLKDVVEEASEDDV